jgi:hypothetical protein
MHKYRSRSVGVARPASEFLRSSRPWRSSVQGFHLRVRGFPARLARATEIRSASRTTGAFKSRSSLPPARLPFCPCGSQLCLVNGVNVSDSLQLDEQTIVDQHIEFERLFEPLVFVIMPRLVATTSWRVNITRPNALVVRHVSGRVHMRFHKCVPGRCPGLICCAPSGQRTTG